MNRYCALLLLLGLAVSPGFASAKVSFSTPLGDIYLSFDTSEQVEVAAADRFRTVVPFTSFAFYVLLDLDFGDVPYNDPARNLSDGMTAWEAGVMIPSEITITSRNLGGTTWVNVGPQDDDWLVGTGGVCVGAVQSPSILVSYAAILLSAAENLELSIVPASPSSLDDPGCQICEPQPGFIDCHNPGLIYPTKSGWQDRSLVVNCAGPGCVVAINEHSWGALKATFDE